MPDLESKESAEQKRNKKEQGLKIQTLNQILRRLSIFLEQLNIKNNSGKRENEKRQLLYCLYRSKNWLK